MIVVSILIAVVIFATDLVIKNKVETSDKLPRTMWKGRLYIQRYHNKGAMLNTGDKYPSLIAALSVVLTLLTLIVFILSLGKRGTPLMRTGLGMLLGGAFNNTYDRLRRKYVVDYLQFRVPWKWLNRIVFNISDFGIMAGAMISCLAYGVQYK